MGLVPSKGPLPQNTMESFATHNLQGLGFRLITEKGLNLTRLHGEQDSRNNNSYTKWSRQIKDFIESKGADGMDLVKAMTWAETQGRQATITNAMVMVHSCIF